MQKFWTPKFRAVRDFRKVHILMSKEIKLRKKKVFVQDDGMWDLDLVEHLCLPMTVLIRLLF